ncbi:glycosyltransferase family 4 protein [Marinobacter sp.]|uniref:glycosyltransferase family 4 protein n=1 Tax=Marinobacter sp. TaxID=50741 RepID=UPI002B26C1BC|nr:glycosyltransferase family 4 protein [Marinobacter sp.]
MPFDNQLSIVFLTVAGPWSGAEVHTVSLAGVFEQRGHSVKIAEFGEPVYSEQLGAKHPLLFCADKRGQCCEARAPLKRSFRHWHQRLKTIQADVAILVKGNFYAGGAAMEAAARICFKTFITIEHMRAPLPPRPETHFFQSAKKPIGLGLWWYITKLKGFTRSIFPHHSICVSRAVAETLTRDYHFPGTKLTVAYTGVDTEKLSPNRAHRQKTRKQLGIDDDTFVFGTLGRLSPMKNQVLLLEAFACWCKQSPKPVKLLLVGDGPEEEKLKRLVETLNIKDQVVFTAFTPHPEEVYPAFDTFCLTSTDEALPIALLEALSCGVPAIATNVGGVPEVIDSDDCGWLVESNNIEDLYRTMKRVSSFTLDQLTAYRILARQRAVENFNIDTCFTSFCQRVESLT